MFHATCMLAYAMPKFEQILITIQNPRGKPVKRECEGPFVLGSANPGQPTYYCRLDQGTL